MACGPEKVEWDKCLSKSGKYPDKSPRRYAGLSRGELEGIHNYRYFDILINVGRSALSSLVSNILESNSISRKAQFQALAEIYKF